MGLFQRKHCTFPTGPRYCSLLVVDTVVGRHDFLLRIAVNWAHWDSRENTGNRQAPGGRIGPGGECLVV
uniref:Uncharacterized protein n=1 Tax=Timema cristinae TaxID=61476 RepID=A0A7R9DQT1_TIMCR|nr:unnamed protein product [Timema cristinae]